MTAPPTPRDDGDDCGRGDEGRVRGGHPSTTGRPAPVWPALSIRTGYAADATTPRSTTTTHHQPSAGHTPAGALTHRRHRSESFSGAGGGPWTPAAAAAGPPGSPLVVGDGGGLLPGRRRISSVGGSVALEAGAAATPRLAPASTPAPTRLPFPPRPPWLAAAAVLGPEIASNLAYYSISVNLVVYLSTVLGFSPGAAAAQAHAWTGLAYLFPLLGGAVADGIAGRPLTVLGAAGLQAAGLVLLTLQARFLAPSTPGGRPPSGAEPAFGLAMAALAAATGGIKPNVSPCGADQFDEEDEEGGGEDEEGRGGGRSQPPSPSSSAADARAAAAEATKASFFNWYYFSINVSALLASAGLVYLQTAVSWTAGFGVPAGAAGVAALVYGWAFWKGWVRDGRAGARQTGTSTSGLVRLGRAVRRKVVALAAPWACGREAVAPAAAPATTSKAEAGDDADAAMLARLGPAWLALLGWNLAYATASTVMVQQVKKI